MPKDVRLEIAEAVARLWEKHAERRGRRLRFHGRRRHCRQLRNVRMILSVTKNSTTHVGSDCGHYQARLIIEMLTGNLLISGEQGC